MSEATDVVDAQIEAYQARDVERFLSHYADDVSVVLFDGAPMFPDKEAMRQGYRKLFADSPNLHVTIANRIAGGEFVIDEEVLTGFSYGDEPSEMTAVAVYRVVDGKIARLMLLR
jgi:uncharacterized protein (TIGR02246 family)